MVRARRADGRRTTGVGFAFGVQPFLIGDALKVALAACLVGTGWSPLFAKVAFVR
ncbi:hypothetical protein [Bosea sp. 685]|uniref:hypothetical protein n=1 Tax=Bosea sp. 685 TaxID=3080057 RepID=UPI0028932781|nr:hypothetical protein [Bosea sp. 685]WNJ90124.1 hypothetical protein RMR04_27665 [Bosea sp. 685]